MSLVTITEAEVFEALADRSDISGYEFSEINFTDIELKGAVFVDCKFTKCNLANVSLLNVIFRGVVFNDSNLMGTNWTEVRKGGNFSFEGCKMDYTCFQSVDLRGVGFDGCMLREADFSGANLSKASLVGAYLAGASFSNVNIEKANFSGAKNYFIDPGFAKIKGAKFSFPEALVLIQALGVEIEM